MEKFLIILWQNSNLRIAPHLLIFCYKLLYHTLHSYYFSGDIKMDSMLCFVGLLVVGIFFCVRRFCKVRLGYSSHRVLPQITVGGWCSLRQHHLPSGHHLPHSSAEAVRRKHRPDLLDKF